MSVDNTTNLNISNAGDIFKNQDVNNTSSPTKIKLSPVNNNAGITEMSTIEEDSTTTFSDAPKPELRQPEISLEQIGEKTITVTPEMAETLDIESKTMTISEFIAACTEKIKGNIGKSELGKALVNGDGTSTKFDSETMECLILLLTMDSKSNLIQTLRNTLQAKIKDRAAKNQEYIDKTAEQDQKNAEQIQKAKEAKKRKKKWGIFGAIMSAIIAIVSAVVTVATLGIAAPAAIVAVAACVVTCVGSALSIAGIATDNKDLQKAGMWVGIAGAVLSLGAGITGFFSKIPEMASKLAKLATVMKCVATAFNTMSGVSQSIFKIIDGINQMDLAEQQKKLEDLKISMTKLDQEIKLLSDMIDKIANFIQDFMKDLFHDEEEVASMIQQMMNAALGIEQNVKC